MLIGLVYCVIQPIIAPLALIYFLVGMLIWKYQVVYLYVPLVESGGKVSLHKQISVSLLVAGTLQHDELYSASAGLISFMSIVL